MKKFFLLPHLAITHTHTHTHTADLFRKLPLVGIILMFGVLSCKKKIISESSLINAERYLKSDSINLPSLPSDFQDKLDILNDYIDGLNVNEKNNLESGFETLYEDSSLIAIDLNNQRNGEPYTNSELDDLANSLVEIYETINLEDEKLKIGKFLSLSSDELKSFFS